MEATGKIVSVIMMVCLMFICYKSCKQIYGYHTTAIVLKSKIKGDDKYLLTVKYTIDDKEYINKIISKRKKSKDDKISIIYDKFDPNDIEMDYSHLVNIEGNCGDYRGEFICYMCILGMPVIFMGLIGMLFSYSMF